VALRSPVWTEIQRDRAQRRHQSEKAERVHHVNHRIWVLMVIVSAHPSADDAIVKRSCLSTGRTQGAAR
jgi:hypothetical protein